MFARTTFAATLLLGASLVSPALAQTQSNPNADSIVKSLTPSDGLNSSTRGIRVGNAPAAGQAAAPAPAPAPAATKPAAVSLNVQFATGSADLTPQATRALDQLGQALSTSTLAAYHFRIE